MPCSIFAVEVAIRTGPHDPFRRALHELLRHHPPSASRAQRRYFYYQVVQQVGANFAAVERGCWDYWPDHDKAVSDFDMWTKGMTAEEGARHVPSHDPPPRYLTFTMAFLLVKGSRTDLGLAQRCRIPEAHLWQRSVFQHVLLSVTAIDFADVKSDVVYLIPGDDAFALTPADLALPKFQYLRPLT